MKHKEIRKKLHIIITAAAISAMLGMTACGTQTQNTNSAGITDSISTVDESADTQSGGESTSTGNKGADSSNASRTILSADDISIQETVENTTDGEHAITADGEESSYSNTEVIKTGDSEGDEADFYGENAAVFATNGATLDLTEMVIHTDGTHANGVFSYGEGTTVNISDSVIETSGNCSGGLMTTGGGTMNAENLTIHTTGNSSAAIRSDRGGGTVNVTGGSYTTDGTGSPVIYSTADITVTDAELTSTASQGIVVEGSNSVTLNDVDLTADNNTKNSDKSDYYQAVMIYQSMSGDAAEGTASFAMNGGSLTNKNGDIFFVNNTVATISLSDAAITNEGDGVFLRAAAAGWGTEGSNGGQVTLNADNQTINGDMIVDSVSSLNLYLTNASSFEGAINPDGADGDVYVELTDGSTWTLTGDSYITSLTCDTDSINLNGYTLYVNGEAYAEGTASEGAAIEVTVSDSGSHDGAPDGAPGQDSDSSFGHGPGSADGHAPDSSDGHGPGSSDGEPPAKPDGNPPAETE